MPATSMDAGRLKTLASVGAPLFWTSACQSDASGLVLPSDVKTQLGGASVCIILGYPP